MLFLTSCLRVKRTESKFFVSAINLCKCSNASTVFITVTRGMTKFSGTEKKARVNA